MSSQAELVAPAVLELVEVFEERGADLKFPDLDAKVLQDAVCEVERAAAEVQRLEAELERARELLSSRQEGLHGKAQRALAYARVFAEEDAELSERLAKVLLPRTRKSVAVRQEAGLAEPGESAPVRRKRTLKQASEPLFSESQPATVS